MWAGGQGLRIGRSRQQTASAHRFVECGQPLLTSSIGPLMSLEQGTIMQKLGTEFAAREAQLQRQHEEVLRAVKTALQESFAMEKAQLLDRIESLTLQLAAARAPTKSAPPSVQPFGTLAGACCWLHLLFAS